MFLTSYRPLVLLVVLLLCAAVSFGQEQESKADFETTFLATNFSAIRFATPRRVQAGDLISVENYRTMNSLERCVLGDWNNTYNRGDTTFVATSTSNARSGALNARTKSLFKLAGTVDVSVRSTISDNDSLSVQSDSAEIESMWAEDSLYTDDARCNVFVDLFSNNYLPSDQTIISKAYFMGGNMWHSYELSLTGAGSGSIGLDRVQEFLEAVPMLSGISSLFNVNVELNVRGESIRSNSLRFSYGVQPTVVDATGFLPVAIQEQLAIRLISLVNELPDGSSMLHYASADQESALMFLDKYPLLDIENDESIVASMFVGENLILYGKFVDNDSVVSTDFADIFSRILRINKVAGRNL